MSGDQPRWPWRGYGADKSHPTSVDEWFGREPFPHERARGFIVDRVDQPANVVVNFELQRVGCPALLESHDVRHCLAAAADA